MPKLSPLYYVRSLAPLTRSAALRFAPLRSVTPFTGSLTHSAQSLVEQLKFMNLCSRCDLDQREGSRSPLSLETRPNPGKFLSFSPRSFNKRLVLGHFDYCQFHRPFLPYLDFPAFHSIHSIPTCCCWVQLHSAGHVDVVRNVARR